MNMEPSQSADIAEPSDAPAPPPRQETSTVPGAVPTFAFFDRMERSVGLSLAVLSVMTVLFLAPFAGKAFNIDEPLFIKAARQIVERPLDPYGFHVLWYDTDMPMSEVTKNPPLASYYIALASTLLGWSEVALHLAFLPLALAMVAGTFLLARRFCRHPFLAGLVALSTPVFLVSSTTVMCDTMMMAFWVWAVLLWIEGIERDDMVWLTAASLLVAASALPSTSPCASSRSLRSMGSLTSVSLDAGSLVSPCPC
jgi:4-amino-4-deoxy-L-arabinose transferase-like glycosyltransferase